MKNIVEIIYPKGERFPQISINGEKISRYMELSDLIYDDMFNWVEQLYTSMDDELCEKYVIQITGHLFHYQILKGMKGLSSYCEEIEFTPVQYTIPVEEKLAYAANLNRTYQLGIPFESEQVLFCTDDPARFGPHLPCDAESSNYFVTAGEEFPAACKYCVIVSDTMRFRRKHGVSYLYLPEHLLALLGNYLNQYHLHLQFINAVFSAAGDLRLDEAARLEYEAYTKEEYRVLSGGLPAKLERGDQFQVTYTYFPKCFADPEVTCTTSAPEVIFARGNTLLASNAGTCTIRMIDKFGNEHHSGNVTVEVHHYVSNISIVLPATSMRIGEKLHFQSILAPANAEDLGEVTYTVSDESIAVFTATNEIYALNAGRVRITVATPRISRSAFITVYPVACDVILPETELRMPQNAIAEIHCSVVPMNANPMPAATWTSSNPGVVRITATGNHACRITSVGLGTATLTCSLEGCSIRKSMEVKVEKIKGCYVATAVYGSYDCPQVWALRRYRDDYLSAHWFGRAFIKLYYTLSPTAVALFGKTKWFNKVWRGILDRKVRKLKAKGYQDTPYND